MLSLPRSKIPSLDALYQAGRYYGLSAMGSNATALLCVLNLDLQNIKQRSA